MASYKLSIRNIVVCSLTLSILCGVSLVLKEDAKVELSMNMKTIPSQRSPKISWNFQGNLLIDGEATGPDAYNWTWAEAQSWCSGNGTVQDPYLIQDLEIDAMKSGSGLIIQNSGGIVFEIENCTFFNATWDTNYAGLQLISCQNGTIRNTTVYDCYYGFKCETCVNLTFQSNIFRDSNSGFHVTSSNYLSLSDGYFENCTENGIYLSESDYCTISLSDFYENSRGLYLFQCSFGKVTQNEFNQSGGVAIDNRYGEFNEIAWNNISDSGSYGIYQTFQWNSSVYDNFVRNTGMRAYYAYQSKDCNITHNFFEKSYYNEIYLSSCQNVNIAQNIAQLSEESANIRVMDSNHIFILNNTINTTDYFYLLMIDNCVDFVLEDNLVINANNDAIDIYQSDKFLITNNSFIDNNRGAHIWHCENYQVSNNTFENNGAYGLYFSNVDNGTILWNIFKDNPVNGLSLSTNCNNQSIFGNTFINNHNGINIGTGNHTISGNLFQSNSYGIYAAVDSQDCTIYNNNFETNTFTAQDEGTDNKWEKDSVGNYWYDYGGIDENGDGIGEDPYINGLGVMDNFPQITPDTNPTLTASNDLEFFYGEPGHSISWVISDVGVSYGTYIIYRNSYFFNRGGWSKEQNISVNLNGLSVGDYSYRIVVQDYTAWHKTYSSVISVTILNNAPEASNLQILPSNAYSNCSLSITWDYSDPEGTDQAAPWIQWYRNDVYQSEFDNTSIIDANSTYPGDLWNCTLRAFDGELYSDPVSQSISILNHLPIIDNVTINPSIPMSTSNLTVSFDYTDEDSSQSLFIYIQWFCNDILQEEYTNATQVNRSSLIPGDIWNVSVQVFDGIGFSDIVNEYVIIGNYIPVVTNLEFQNEPAVSYEDLEITFEAYDLDTTDSLELNISWYCNGFLETEYANLTRVNASALYPLDLWNVTIQATDGTLYSSLVSCSITIENAIPLLSNVSFREDSGDSLTDLEILYEMNDLDGLVGVSCEVLWYMNGIIQNAFTNHTLIEASHLHAFDEWNVSLSITDGIAYSDPIWLSIIFSNHVPTLSYLNLTFTEEGLILVYTYTDVDDHPEENTTIHWYHNDIHESVFDQLLEIPILYLNDSDSWYAVVTPHDGYEYGDSLSTNEISILLDRNGINPYLLGGTIGGFLLIVGFGSIIIIIKKKK